MGITNSIYVETHRHVFLYQIDPHTTLVQSTWHDLYAYHTPSQCTRGQKKAPTYKNVITRSLKSVIKKRNQYKCRDNFRKKSCFVFMFITQRYIRLTTYCKKNIRLFWWRCLSSLLRLIISQILGHMSQN